MYVCACVCCLRRTNSRSPKFLPSSWTDTQRVKFVARICSLNNSQSTAIRLQTLQKYINPQTMKLTHVTLMNSVNIAQNTHRAYEFKFNRLII